MTVEQDANRMLAVVFAPYITIWMLTLASAKS